MSSKRSRITVLLILAAFATVMFFITLSQTEIPLRVGGIRVHNRYNPDTFFPASWVSGEAQCQGVQVDLAEAARILPVIETFASAYSENVIDRNLKDIYLLDELRCYDSSYGGTNSTSAIYITVGTEQQGYSAEFVNSLLHAEFSSILMRNYAFAYEEWAAVNEADFVYSDNALGVLEQDNRYDQTDELLAGGFLWHYSTTSLENDFNNMAGWLFTQYAELCDLAREHPRIAAKTALAIGFYQFVDPATDLAQCEGAEV